MNELTMEFDHASNIQRPGHGGIGGHFCRLWCPPWSIDGDRGNRLAIDSIDGSRFPLTLSGNGGSFCRRVGTWVWVVFACWRLDAALPSQLNRDSTAMEETKYKYSLNEEKRMASNYI